MYHLYLRRMFYCYFDGLIVPLVLAVMVLALRTGIDCYEETKAQVAKLGTRVSFDIVDTMYLLDEITDIGDLFHGD